MKALCNIRIICVAITSYICVYILILLVTQHNSMHAYTYIYIHNKAVAWAECMARFSIFYWIENTD